MAVPADRLPISLTPARPLSPPLNRSYAAKSRRGAILAVLALLAASLIGLVGVQPASAAESLLVGTSPQVTSATDTAAVELGMGFSPVVDGSVTGITFYKGPQNTGTHLGRLWSSSGVLLASVSFTGETATGWQRASLTQPVYLTANETYVVSYYAPRGGYSVTQDFFTKDYARSNLVAASSTATRGNGLYRYGAGGGFPTSSYRSSNYFVDVLFTAGARPVSTPPTSSESLFADTVQPQTVHDTDRVAVQLGARFVPAVAGRATGVRFYKGPENTGTHVGRLWTEGGQALASVTFSAESSSGWQQANFQTPVALQAGATYVVSYHAPVGRYSSTLDFFSSTHRRGNLSAPGSTATRGNGVYAYGSSTVFPSSSYRSSNYWVDVVFSADPAAPVPTTTVPVPTTTVPVPTTTVPVPTTTAPVPTTTAPVPTTTAPVPTTTAPVPTTTATVAPPTSLRRTAPDGGRGYFSAWSSGLPATDDYFPVGVWFESVTSQGDIDLDKAAGLNLYVALTGNSDVSLIQNNGMHVLGQQEEWVGRTQSPALAGYVLYDEVDMIEGPSTGYTTMDRIVGSLPADGRLRYNNYGKGVTFWETTSQASRFVNSYTDVVSADNYWFTDPNICGAYEGGALLKGSTALTTSECRKASNYGETVRFVRELDALDGKRQPVWNFVELGHPFSEDYAPTIKPAEVKGAVWSGIINGARGVVYFNHSFGGSCLSQHALREGCYSAVRAEVTRTNAQIQSLAPVLNADTVDGLFTTTGGVDTMTKIKDGGLHVFAGSRSVTGQSVTFSAPCVGNASAVVVGENRSIPVSNGRFTDTFADGNAVHIYRIVGGSICGLG